MSKRKRAAPTTTKSNKKQKTEEHIKWPINIVENSPFELVELTEIILSHLIMKDTISVLNIAKTSRRNNDLVRSRKFWDKFGYNLLTDEDPVPIDIIKVLLSQFRVVQLQKEMSHMQTEMSTLMTRVKLPQSILAKVATKVTKPQQGFEEIDARAYLAYHNLLTAEACELLLKIKSIIGISFFQIADLVSLIECSKENMQHSGAMRDIYCSVKMFQKGKPSLDFHLLYQVTEVRRQGMYAYFQIWKKFLPKNRSVLLIHGSVSLPADDEEHRGYNDELSTSYEFGFFLKYDANSGIIEECASFSDYTRRNFPAMPADVWKRVICAVSETKTCDVNKFPSRNLISIIANNPNRDPILYCNVKLRK